jgi:hypothetical protein
MIALHHERGNFWLRLKLFFTLGQCAQDITTMKPIAPKQKRRSHRATAFFELP